MSAGNTTIHSGKCPAGKQASVACTSSILSSKWMPQLLFALSYDVKRFSDLKRQVGDINPRTLSQRLDELETFGIVTKQAFAEVPPRVEYSLTAKGRDLLPILEQMVAWGDKYNVRPQQ